MTPPRHPVPAGRGRILLLAPHSDDLAYSLGATLLSPAWRGRGDLTALTLFTRSRHAPYLEGASEEEITRVRMEEDRRYTGRLGAEWIAGPFGEAMTRGYPDVHALYAFRTVEEDPLYPAVEAYLAPLLDGTAFRLVLAPLGIGGHIEHEIVFQAVSRRARIPALFYEDQPYAADYSDRYLERWAERRLGAARRAVACAGGERLDAKIGQLLTYASQFREEDAAPLRWYAGHRRPDAERLLRLDRGPRSTHPAELLWGTAQAVEALAALLRRPAERAP